MKQRIISAIIAILICVPIIILGGKYYIFLISVLALLAYKEILSLSIFDKKMPILIKILGVISLLCLVFINFESESFNSISYVQILIPLLLLSTPTIFYQKNYNSTDAFYLIGLILFIGLGFNGLIFIGQNIYLLIYLFSITILGDTFAMLFGKLIGKHKLAPNISPKKTVEGSIGGFLIALVVPIIIYINLIGDFSYQLLIVTALLAVFAQIGDLIFSKIKRDNKIKDFSNIMPGHGGILDRLDSILIVTILFMILRVFL